MQHKACKTLSILPQINTRTRILSDSMLDFILHLVESNIYTPLKSLWLYTLSRFTRNINLAAQPQWIHLAKIFNNNNLNKSDQFARGIQHTRFQLS